EPLRAPEPECDHLTEHPKERLVLGVRAPHLRRSLDLHECVRPEQGFEIHQPLFGDRIPRNSQSPPNEVETTSSDALGCAPTSSRIGTSPSTIRLRRVPRPSTSTSTTSPGSTGREFAGVPDRITSPGTSVIVRAMSATRYCMSHIISSVEPSWRTSPFTNSGLRFPWKSLSCD